MGGLRSNWLDERLEKVVFKGGDKDEVEIILTNKKRLEGKRKMIFLRYNELFIFIIYFVSIKILILLLRISYHHSWKSVHPSSHHS